METIFKVLLIAMPLICESRIISAPRLKRLTSAEPMPSYYYTNINGVPGTYSFGYDSFDPSTGNTQYRTEERYPNGTVVGSYGFVDARGQPQRFRYVADVNGYRVTSDPVFTPVEKPIQQLYMDTTEPSVTWSRPRRPNRNRGSYFNKLPIQKTVYSASNNEILPALDY
ncbi:uncharacterized protein LOC106132118 [Amyelois transitella]|uniref:uncharacterized protein LOC106132118 n=1 Tax=Amyelois transitella TaxID=680683 RepID=UPI00298F479F|nr:uncharacterized protein LOC106132118 [Amyelois transitella]